MKIVSNKRYFKNKVSKFYIIFLFFLLPNICLGSNNLSISGVAHNDTNLNSHIDDKADATNEFQPYGKYIPITLVAIIVGWLVYPRRGWMFPLRIILAITIIIIFYLFITNDLFYIIPVLGLASLIIPLFLSLSPEYGMYKLNTGEIRKIIVLSLTVVYILFLSLSFHQALVQPKMGASNYVANLTMTNDGDKASQIGIYANISSSNEVIFLPQKISTNFSKYETQVILIPAANFTSIAGKAVPMPVGNASSGSSMVPLDAISTFSSNFLYVYLVIILFYFGSRFIDERNSNKNIEKFKDGDPVKVAELRLALGDIGSKEYEEIMRQFKSQGVTRKDQGDLVISDIKPIKNNLSFRIYNPSNKTLNISAITVTDPSRVEKRFPNKYTIEAEASLPIDLDFGKEFSAGNYEIKVEVEGFTVTKQFRI